MPQMLQTTRAELQVLAKDKQRLIQKRKVTFDAILAYARVDKEDEATNEIQRIDRILDFIDKKERELTGEVDELDEYKEGDADTSDYTEGEEDAAIESSYDEDKMTEEVDHNESLESYKYSIEEYRQVLAERDYAWDMRVTVGAQVEAQKTALLARIAELQQNAEDLRTSLDQLQGKNATLESEMAKLTSDMAASNLGEDVENKLAQPGKKGTRRYQKNKRYGIH